jgi:hypothetical protein
VAIARRTSAQALGLSLLLGCSDLLGCSEPALDVDAAAVVDGGATRDAAAVTDAGALPWDARPPSTDAGADGGARDAGPRDGGIDCGPHGMAHGDHCHCEAGYVERERRCVAVDECRGDDPYEPDDRARDAVPWAGEPLERWLCPGDRDHVSVELMAGERLRVHVLFSHDELDIDVALWTPGTDPRFDRPALQALSRTDDEELTHLATRDGAHLVRVFSADRGGQSAYRLQIEVEPRAD